MSDTQPATIMSALAILAMVNDTVLPALGRDGFTPQLIWDPTVALMKRLAAGETADGIVAIDWALDELAGKGLIDPATRRPIAQAVVGVAVRPGAARPDISTAEALKQTLLEVPSLVYSQAGASGIYFEKLIDQLGIGEAIRAKALVIPKGLTGERVASGEVELAIQQLSELMVVPGIDVVGPLPAEVNATTDFSAAVFTGAKDKAGAARFIDALLTDEARAAYIRTGLVPLF
ncbi:substrate-binding domain-containing protein [Devosia sp.]|uniref:substrate-binding domain-containing protein n=1 Tax=Devosia sp. TaxID=1871048 RepID=UPI002602144D|nr:substrate-binding domain-containing protein [Devosia sp.]